MGDPVEIELEHAGDRSEAARSEVLIDPPTGRRTVLLGLAALGLLVVVIGTLLAGLAGDPNDADATAVDRGGGEPVPAEPVPAPTAPPWSAPNLPVTSPAAPDPAPSTTVPAPIRVRELGRPLTFVPTSVVVVGLAVGADLVEIELDTGTIRRTRLPDPVPDRADVQIVATADATLIAGSVRSDGSGDADRWVAYLVPVGEAARPAEGAPGQPWTGTPPDLAADAGPRAGPDVGSRPGPGPGPDVGSRPGPGPGPDVGSRPGPGPAPDTGPADERVSPSGTTAVLARPAPDGQGVLHELVDLATGERTTLIGSHRAGQGVSESASIEWSADGRLVLFLDGLRLVQHDTVSGQRALVGGPGDLMELRRFTVRPSD